MELLAHLSERHGVTLAPGTQVTFPVDQLIPGTPATTVHVVSRSGRVAAALSDSQVNGLAALGADWVPAAGEPGLTSVLTGIPGDPDATRTLLLVAPGGDDAVVNLHLVTAEGTLSPDALQGLSVPAGKLFQLVVPPPADGGATTDGGSASVCGFGMFVNGLSTRSMP